MINDAVQPFAALRQQTIIRRQRLENDRGHRRAVLVEHAIERTRVVERNDECVRKNAVRHARA